MLSVSPEVEAAYRIALQTRERAYAPYSRFRVGAAARFADVAEPVGGCNVENASFGATICAERTALLGAGAAHGKRALEFMVVVTDEKTATPPCALCLQMLAEFAADDTPIYLANASGVQRRYLLRELLPVPFRSFQP